MSDLHRLARHFEIQRDQFRSDAEKTSESNIKLAMQVSGLAYADALADVQKLLVDSDALLSTEVGAKHTLSADIKCPQCKTKWTPSASESPLNPICDDCELANQADIDDSDEGPFVDLDIVAERERARGEG